MAEKPADISPGTRAPGYERAPAHRVAYLPGRAGVTIRAEGMPIATTTDVVTVEESGYPARYYLARDGVAMACLVKTDKVTYCPFKGLATYYVIRSAQGEIRDAVWSYERPYREAELLRDRLAFDATKVEEAVDTAT